MTIASDFLPSTNAAQVVRPMKGGMFHPSTAILTSVRGAVTLKTPSAALKVPFKPVSCSSRLVSREAADNEPQESAKVSPSLRAQFLSVMRSG